MAGAILAGLCLSTAPATSLIAQDQALKLLFLGDKGHHKPADRAAQLIPVLETRGMKVTYSEKMSELALDNLRKYDGLIIYSNTTEISREQESALLEYVAGGGGFIPLHCASYCFLNSPAYIDLGRCSVQQTWRRSFLSTEIIEPNSSDHARLRWLSKLG